MEIRPATTEDAEAIREIYNVWVTTSTFTFDMVPRTAEQQRLWLSERSGAHAVLVAIDGDGAVVGFASLSPYRNRPAYSTTVEDSIYIHPDHHRRGVGRKLLTELVATARRHGFHTVISRIVGGHQASIELHRSVPMISNPTEREVGRKFGTWLDVVVLQLLLGASPVDPPG